MNAWYKEAQGHILVFECSKPWGTLFMALESVPVQQERSHSSASALASVNCSLKCQCDTSSLLLVEFQLFEGE
jgi:hypothetical protein